jgi:hypothetical protein
VTPVGAIKDDTGVSVAMGGYSDLTQLLNATLAQPRIYNRALSAYEIEKLYNNITFLTENDGLVGDWELDKGLGVNTVAILGHNILSPTVVKIQADNSANWSNPELNTTLNVNGRAILNFYSQTYYYKYWRFYFTGQVSIEIGRIFLGKYITIDPSSLDNFKVTKLRSDNVIHGKNRQKFASIGNTWRKFELEFPPSDEDMVYLIDKLYNVVGNHSSFIFCNFDTERLMTLVEPCYVSINDDMGFNHSNRDKFSYRIVLEEEL